MNKDKKNEYSLSVIESNLEKKLKGSSLEDVIRPMYYKEIVQCTNILDIEYPITALSILGRALDKITKEYCDQVIVDTGMFNLKLDKVTYEKLADVFWGSSSKLDNRIDLMVGKCVDLDGIKLKLNKKIINNRDYNIINSIYLLRCDHICGETEYMEEDNCNYEFCMDPISDLESMARSYIEPGINTLFKLDIFLKELYTNLTQKENELKVDNHLGTHIEDISEGIVILECDESNKQGTAFLVKDVGFVTCAHVIGTNTHAFKGNNFKCKYPIKVKGIMKSIDLAIIEIPGLQGVKSFEIKPESKLSIMDEIYIAGYPNYRIGDSCRIVKSQVAAERPISGINRLLLDKGIICGNSGGPALTLDGEYVVGVAVTGADNIDKASDTENNAIIPIDAIEHVIKSIKNHTEFKV
ncbi:serine protease [Clostridium estertheticum]|uniref:S1 family peptidase n=1 Tax=Clostridium estertheticum TaxID=238834 RepID=UPI001C0D7BFE|nr:serine protease [Clostridium estertheticum]MBU3175198.1 serine protease [Clostridium estertheticum]